MPAYANDVTIGLVHVALDNACNCLGCNKVDCTPYHT